jgi:hypothetical protein
MRIDGMRLFGSPGAMKSLGGASGVALERRMHVVLVPVPELNCMWLNQSR